MIAVIDYGMGNLRSVQKALELVGAEAKVTSDPKEMVRADGIVLPGVGAFGAAVERLREKKLVEVLRKEVQKGKPFLGICLGLQLLFSESEESPGVEGLGLVKGRVKALKVDMNIPHMGWNQIKLEQKSKLFKGIPDETYFYFVHSFVAAPEFQPVVGTTTDYGAPFVSTVLQDNIYGVQFHPEKSQFFGLQLLKNFVKLT